MATRFQRPQNGTVRHLYELIKQLQDLHIDVALFSETHLKPHDRFFIPNCHFYRTDCYPERKGGRSVAVRKGIPHNHSLIQWKRQGSAYILVIVKHYLQLFIKSPGTAWNDTDIIVLLSFRIKYILVGDLNAKHPFWRSAFSKPSDEKLLQFLFYVN
jgi:hypothetical protein